MVNGMVVKVGGGNINGHIIGRTLNRSKGINLLSHREHNNTTGMLSGCSVDSYTAGSNALNFAASLMNTTLFIIVFYIPICRFIRKGSNGSGLVGLPLSKDNLRVFMGLTLIFPGKI